MAGFNSPGCNYYRIDTDSLIRIAIALERIADKLEEKEAENEKAHHL